MFRNRFNLRNVVAIAICLAGFTVFSGCNKEEDPNNNSGTGKPDAVMNFTATEGNEEVSLSWNAPFDNGGVEITGYEVTKDNWVNKVRKTASELSHTYSSLINGTQYTFKVRAVNANGVGTESTQVATPKSNSSTSLKVGQEYQGGIIAYVDANGKSGLIAAPSDQSIGIVWFSGIGTTWFATDATGTAIGTGKNNTKRIVQMQGNGTYAAKLCDDLVLKGYDDWFLPSKDELNELYRNRGEIGGFSYVSNYWSSSEQSANYAWLQNFSNGGQNSNGEWGRNKDSGYRVRAVRSF